MAPSPAETVRTLASGRLPGLLQIDEDRLPRRVQHATDPYGRPLLLLAEGADLPQLPCPVVLAVDDVPPVAGAPSFGRALLSGHLHRLPPAVASAAVDGFAMANPVPDLLDVQHGRPMYRIEIDRVRLARSQQLHEVDPAGYRAAVPDPLHELERDLLTDLADHHAQQMASYFRFLLAVTGVPCCVRAPRAVRLDRYGFVVDLGPRAAVTAPAQVAEPVSDDGSASGRWVRLDFSQPVGCRHELAYLLQPVLLQRNGCGPRR